MELLREPVQPTYLGRDSVSQVDTVVGKIDGSLSMKASVQKQKHLFCRLPAVSI